MILEELCALYSRQFHEGMTDLAPLGLQYRRLDFLIEIALDGKFLALIPTENLARQGHRGFLLPAEIKRGRQVAANFLWDHADYVLGEAGGLEVSKKRQAFAQRIVQAAECVPGHSGLAAVRSFYELGQWQAAREAFDRVAKNLRNPSLGFKLSSELPAIGEDESLRQAIEEGVFRETRESSVQCLVSGEEDELSMIHPAIKGLMGSLNTGATLVSFNLESSRFLGKKQGLNAPIGQRAAFAYTSALNELLKPGSDRYVRAGDITLVFWTDGDPLWEEGFAQFLTLSRGQLVYEKFYKLLRARQWQQSQCKLFLLALSAQKTRIAVRYWQKLSLAEAEQCLLNLYEDLRLFHAPYEPEPLSLYALAAAASERREADQIEGQNFLEIFRSIMLGKMYPQSLFCITINLIRKEKYITYHRAAIVKACLIRSARCNQVQEEVGVALDPAFGNIGYCLGRLFAVLERLQEEASAGQSSHLRDRYYATASTSPAAIFPVLLRQQQNQLSRVANRTLRTSLEQEMADIFAHIREIPRTLLLSDQGRFAVGYYHQRQTYFKSRNKEDKPASLD